MLRLIAICLAFVVINAQNEGNCPNDKLCGDCQGNVCIVCYNSYPVNGKCVEPSDEIDNCLEYTDENNCAKCQHGLRPMREGSDEDNESDSCEEITLSNCDVVQPNEPTKCKICSSGLLVTVDGECVAD